MSEPGFSIGHPDPANVNDEADTPIGTVAGAVADNAPETENPLPLAKAVDGDAYSPGYATGDRAVIPIDKDSGGVLCHTRKLTAADDFASVAGDIAHDSADSGAPIKIGGKAASASGGSEPAAVTVGDRVNGYFDQHGRQVMLLHGKDVSTIAASAARTSTMTGVAQNRPWFKGIEIFFTVTAASGSPSLVLTVQVQDPISGNYITVATATAVTGVSNNYYQLYPGITAVAGSMFNLSISRNFRIVVTPGTADSCTYSVAMCGLI